VSAPVSIIYKAFFKMAGSEQALLSLDGTVINGMTGYSTIGTVTRTVLTV